MRNKKQNKKTHTLKYNRNTFWLINYKNKKKNKTEKERKQQQQQQQQQLQQQWCVYYNSKQQEANRARATQHNSSRPSQHYSPSVTTTKLYNKRALFNPLREK